MRETGGNHHQLLTEKRHCAHSRYADSRLEPIPKQAGCRLRWIWSWFLRHRLALGLASLVWLLWRSGSQPRRLAYPCQQAAAANLGAWALLIIPGMHCRPPHCRESRVGSWRWAALIPALAIAIAILITTGTSIYSTANPIQQAIGALPPPRTGVALPATVSIVRNANDPLTAADVEQMVRQAVQQAGGLVGLGTGMTVVIKPNLVQSGWAPGEGVTTDPRVVRAVIKLAQEAGAGRIIIAEGSAGSRWNDYLVRDVTYKAFTDSGYDQDADRHDDQTGVELCDLNDAGGLDQHDPAKVNRITLPNGVIRTQYWVPKLLLKPDQGGICDFLISVPTLKNHENGGVTLALKNRVGCAPSDIYHADFAPFTQQMKWSLVHSRSRFPRDVADDGPFAVPPTTDIENLIVQYTAVDLNLVRPQDFVVIDGLVGITNGPVGVKGVVSRSGPSRSLIMAGKDSVAVDTIGSLVMGYDPTQIPQIAWADNRELGTMDTSVITVIGEHVASLRQDLPSNYGDTVRADNVRPTLSNISLLQGQQVSGPLTITGIAADDRALAKVELRLTQSAHEEIVAALARPGDSFALEWDSNSVATGTYRATLTAYDAALNEASISRDIVVARPPLPVIVLNTTSLVQTALVTTRAFNSFTIRNTGVGTLNYTVQADQPWVHVSPAGGSLDTATHTLQVSYDSEALMPDTYTATITVNDPGAYNNPRTIAVSLVIQPAKIDMDGDGDLDQDDFGRFQLCFSGPGVPQESPGCAGARLDDDLDVDQADLQMFAECMSGPGTMISPDCAK